MKQRCPDSLFIGLAELKDWKWIINETGYANIIPSQGNAVYGSLCFLSKRDEMALDESEGVPWLYEKMTLPVKRVLSGEEKSSDWAEGGDVQVKAMAYVDVQRKEVGKIEREYVVWIKKAAEDGMKCGMPSSYVEKYLVPFLPEDDKQLEDIIMVRTTRFGEQSAGIVPRGPPDYRANCISTYISDDSWSAPVMPGEATILEGPVTPAPVFAYRAVRGIFFGSPDSSPEHDNKENVDPTPVSSPQKLGMMDERLQLTPSHKRKRDGGATILSPSKAMLSPTKGILRTPGLATPRAKLLKEINVKFKSVSPESAQQKPAAAKNAGNTNTNRGASSNKDSGYILRVSKSMGDLEPAKKELKVVAQTKNGLPPTTNTTAFPPSAMDAYMQQTEKEMKKLVRYGQKMREYARKKDAENVELKSMVEHLQRENERLRRAVDGEFQRTQDQDKSGNVYAGTVQGSGRIASTGLKLPKQSVKQENVTQRSATQQLRQPSASNTVSGTKSGPELSTAKHRTPSDHQQPPASISFHPKSKTDFLNNALPVRSASSGAPTQPSARTTTGNTHTNKNAAAALANIANTGTGSTRLAPDRLAAARERLRQRAEARKSSVEDHTHQHDHHGYDDSSPAKVQQREGILIDINIDDDADAVHQTQTANMSREQSVLDWVNL
ncbi:hypothetical protein LTR10_015247 [Elasticomyces elasticus]|uniref:gamma-glutamylcyclotransferase n=1 Tax=Exophiala sideris TaxID=1016849 RepID=A0ABR0JEK3_9EURO|nr:hypothetical protein LTR10_015247 [Elasticomyces elasticus]KAK5032722.1 hypothetical protein LTS07_004132 [Exophiala sideris]KAK5062246.1 hypothetical protein LTR69_004604 [Exophiala sideris]